jgi:WD40 repeat protein
VPGQVFLSYGRSDRGVAFRVAQRLDEEGFSVWWDPKIAPGVTYDRVIERALAQADCVVTLWSAHAVESDWVRAESDEGRRRGILVPVLIEDVQPPLQFRLIETIDLRSWVADPAADAFDRLRDAVAHRAPPLTAMERWREALVGEPAMDRRRSDPRSSWVSSARFAAPGAAIVSSGDGALSRYSVPALEEQSSVGAHQGAVWSCAANARAVLSGGTDSTARVWDPDTLEARRVLDDHQAWVLGTALSRDGTTAVSSGRDGSVCVWDLGSGSLRHVLAGHRGAVWTVELVEQSDRVVTGSDDQTLRVWSLNDGRNLSTLRGHTAPVMAAALLPDGERLVSGGYDRVIRLWDLRSAREVDRLEGSADWILSLAATPDGTLVAAGTNGGELLFWDLATLQLVAQLPTHQGPVMSLDFRPEVGLLSGSADKTVALLSRAPLR